MKYTSLWNESLPIVNDCRLGRFILNHNMRELLDSDKLVVFQNDQLPVSNDCSLGRYKLK